MLSRVLNEANDDDANITSIFHFRILIYLYSLLYFHLYNIKQYGLITTNGTFHWNIRSLL